MKKVILTVVIFASFIAIGFIPFNKQIAIKINASYLNCYKELNTPSNWRKWQPELKKTDDKVSSSYKISNVPRGSKIAIPGGYFLLKQQSSDNLLVKKVDGNSVYDYSYTIVPGYLGVTATVVVTFKTNVIGYMVPSLKSEFAQTSITNFKQFMEDPLAFYGFNIHRDFITEENIIVKTKTVIASDVYKQGAEMQKQLLAYIPNKHLVQKGMVMAQFKLKNADSILMLIGLPIDKKVNSERDYTYMNIPSTKVLVADFTGKYYNKNKIYVAMSNYVQDKFQHPKIAPIENFVSHFPVNDTDVVSFRLVYPIF